MKKNSFILFSLYFFVIQAIFAWFLRWDYRFFCLAGINTFFISIIWYITRDKNNSSKNIKTTEENIAFSEKTHYIQKPKHKKHVHHFWFFVIAVLCGFFLWFWIPSMDLLLQIFFITLLSFFIFIIFASLFNFKPFRVRESKLYFIVLFFSLLWYILSFFNINIYNFNESANSNLSWDVYISWYDESEFVSIDADLTWDNTDIQNIDTEEDLNIDLSKNATFEDAIKYLLDTNSITLLTNKIIKFNHISSDSVDYPYYRTAYWLWMIGKTLNPSKSLLCETYVVMKWLAEAWNVPSYTDIKQAYWTYAKNNDKLPSCLYWKFLSLADLK